MYTCITTCSAVDISNNVSELVQQPACSRTLVHVHAHTHVHARTDTYTHIHTYTHKTTTLSNPPSKPKPSKCLAANAPLVTANVPLAAAVIAALTLKLPRLVGLDCKVSYDTSATAKHHILD
jgi:hypothetical protein